MLRKLSINPEENIINEILLPLDAELRKKVLKNIKEVLISKNIPVKSSTDIPHLAEEHLTLKETKTIFLDTIRLVPAAAEDTRILKAEYLEKRISRVIGGDKRLRRQFVQNLTRILLELGLIDDQDVESWSKLPAKERRSKVFYHAANYLYYLELEDVFTTILEPKSHLTDVVREVRNVDIIKNMTNSEIVAFLDRILLHEKEFSDADKKELLETIIDTFISNHHYYRVSAVKYFSLTDIYNILVRRIGLPDRQGKIGQKAAGMILAYRILTTEKSDFSDKVKIPKSYYLTSDVFFECQLSHSYNWSALKYRFRDGDMTEEELEDEYLLLRQAQMEIEMPDIIRIELRKVLEKVGHVPVIVRSSSLLEDSKSSFSGKYDSFFFANQPLHDDPAQDLELRVDSLIEKIFQVYVSLGKPEVLIYRRERGLLDVDERMSVLIQTVEGKRYGKYYLPALSGVGLSQNNRVNTGRIKWDDPVLRIGMGLGTGIVDIKGNQVKVVYPANPEYSTILDFYQTLKSSQKNIDVLNLENDTVESIPKSDLFEYLNSNDSDDENIRYLKKVMGEYFLSTAEVDYLMDGIGLNMELDQNKHVVTLDGLKKTGFYPMSEWILRILSEKYVPADVEFTLNLTPSRMLSDENVNNGTFTLTVLQCRQLTGILEHKIHAIPEDMLEKNVLALVNKDVTNGYVPNIGYIVYVDPDEYYQLDETQMHTIARLIGQINSALKGQRFILIGPGRWGSSLPFYGIKVTYSEIYNTLGLIEISKLLSDASYSEPSLGSHFGNDVRESNIITMTIYPGMGDSVYQSKVLQNSQNLVAEFFQGHILDDWVTDVVRIIDTKTVPSKSINKDRQALHIIANAPESIGIMYLGEKKKKEIAKQV